MGAREWSADPSPIELLRAAVTTCTPSNPSIDQALLDRRAETLNLFNQEWKYGSPPMSLWPALKGIRPPASEHPLGRLRLVDDIGALKSFVEKIVVDPEGAQELQVENCDQLWLVLRRLPPSTTNDEIAALVMDMISRLRRLGLKVRSSMFELGMYYAALSLSIPTFKHFFTQWKYSGNPTMHFGAQIIEGLYHAVDTKLFINPSYDTRPLLKMVTGEGIPGRSLKDATIVYDKLLATIRQEPRLVLHLLCLLTALQSDVFLYRLWDKFLRRASSWNEEIFYGAYHVVQALIKFQRSETALDFLESLAKQCNGTLPHLTTAPNLHVLTDDRIVGKGLPDLLNDTDYQSLIDTRFQDMEQRLGIRWEGEHQVHQNIALNTATGSWSEFTDHPLITIDGDCSGYDDMSRLCPEIATHGCSKSPEELGQIAELLQELEGNVQPVQVELPTNPATQLNYTQSLPQFRWCPQHLPIQFSDCLIPTSTNQPQRWTPTFSQV
ncbi:hypothetical protein N7470_000511 [Penicillium chermesinum]|nr:hypothetical protein N7470_000511 [Penicillium chermesinum]